MEAGGNKTKHAQEEVGEIHMSFNVTFKDSIILQIMNNMFLNLAYMVTVHDKNKNTQVFRTKLCYVKKKSQLQLATPKTMIKEPSLKNKNWKLLG